MITPAMRRIVASLCLALLAGVVPATATAQAYPTRPIRIVVGLAPGGVGDITTRAVAQKMSQSLGQQVVVENKPGGGQILGLNTAARAPADGYTLVLLGSGNASTQLLFKDVPFDVQRDFAYISTVGTFELAVFARPDSPFGNLRDLVAAAKARPGRLNIATINVGSTQNLTAELLKSVAGIDVVVVPYKSTADVVSAVLAGDVQAAVETLPPIMVQIKGKTLKALSLTSARRFAGLPDVPTAVESGFPNLVAASWNGIAAPAGTPAPILDQLNKAIRDAVAAEDTAASMQQLGVAARSSTAEEMRVVMKTDLEKWKSIIDAANIPRQ